MFNKLFRKKEKGGFKLDFSTIDSNEKAQSLHSEGKISKLHLFPLNLGGDDVVQNTVYVPFPVVELKHRFDDMVVDLLNGGLVSSYTAKPAYKGKSFIPSSITITASGEREFSQTIDIW